VLTDLIDVRVADWAPAFAAHPELWHSLQDLMLVTGWQQLVQLCRRYEAHRGDAVAYLNRHLAQRTKRPFGRLLDEARAELLALRDPGPAKPVAPTGRRRSDAGTWTALQPPTPREAMIYADNRVRGEDDPTATLVRALAVLDPDAIGLVIEAKYAGRQELAARARRQAAVRQLRRRVATLVIPPSHQAAVAAVLSALDHQ
jgi:hypothetical protein